MVVVGTIVIWFLSARRIFENLARTAMAVAAVGITLFALGKISSVEYASNNLLSRHEQSGETVEERLVLPIGDILEAASVAPFGSGFGSEQVGGIFMQTGVMSFRTFEAQFPRIVLETGLIGLAGCLIAYFVALRALYEVRKTVPDEARRRSIVVGMFLIGSLFYLNVAFDHVASFFAWTLIATLLASSEPGRLMPHPRYSEGR